MLTVISEVEIRKKYSSKNFQISRKIRGRITWKHMETPVLEALFNKAQTKGLLLYQKQLQHWYFPAKFTNLLETPVLKNI